MTSSDYLDDFARRSLGTDSREEMWLSFLKENGIARIAEIGIWKGEFAEQLLTHAPGIQQYYMIDPWAHLDNWNKPLNVPEKAFNKVFDEAMSRTSHAEHKRTVLRGQTSEVIDSIPDESLDFAYIDGDHTLRGITQDLAHILPKIRPGGFIAGDDFTSTPWQHDKNFEPTLVFPYAVYFAEAMRAPIYALTHDQFLIHVHTAAGYSFTDHTGQYPTQSLQPLLNHRA